MSKIAIVSTSGGEAAIAADEAEELGFDLPELSARTITEIGTLFSFAELHNPFDVTGQFVSDPTAITSALSAFCADDAFDAVLFVIAFEPPNAASHVVDEWIKAGGCATDL